MESSARFTSALNLAISARAFHKASWDCNAASSGASVGRDGCAVSTEGALPADGLVAVAAAATACSGAGAIGTWPSMMKRETLAIAKIYVPAKRRATLDPDKAREIAESMLQVGQQTPILVRRDGERFVLVEGLHRLEACKQLGEETIVGYLVQARRH